MRHLLTASHGPLASAILQSAAFIGGDSLVADVAAIEVSMEDSAEKIRAKIESVFSAYGKEDEVIAIADVFGGNVANILTEYIGRRKLYLITGMNLAMVLEAILADPDMEAEELAVRLCEAGRDGVKLVNCLMEENSEEEEI